MIQDLVAVAGRCLDVCPGGAVCKESIGIPTRAADGLGGDDFAFAASFVATAADKGETMNADKVVYLNSILGINKVTGYNMMKMASPPPMP